ncbi:helix-turn-helix transcriptional regulator [Lacrimispora sphenoides]|uniref:DNA-binding transcriptional regulator, XRE-family HTH domain n=1 Tax=Lacrimispora sphenoides JCM 1415 TaxID=1297793 RepID=A0ABY1C6C0_9FIRM|nr:helix-turn-helix transcriptional regulator [Lacrimispora sphenoides]SET73697.1 DNA-binding transcriptional regulator, XRE-family HTH domain [[Clostridium] sphenoides JCM 1415]SUY50874.1 putative transcriptional regulator [Lacrimispora sphenoides]
MSKLITQIKKNRDLVNLSQAELASIVGVRRETIIRLEKGQYNPSLKLAMDISKVFNVPIETIFSYEEET